MMRIRVVDYAPYPGGRFMGDGPYSGEWFRDEVLRPTLQKAIKENDQLEVLLDGAPGYGSSFLEEAFGGLIRLREFSPEQLAKFLVVKAGTPLYSPFEKLVAQYIRQAVDRTRAA